MGRAAARLSTLFHVDGKPLRELKSECRRACEAADMVAGRKAGGAVLSSGTSTQASAKAAALAAMTEVVERARDA
jgi:hypothetical protein